MLASVSTLLTTVGLPKSPALTGNGGLLRGSPRLPFDRLEQRGLFAADVRAGAAPDLDVEGRARVRGCSRRAAVAPRLIDGVLHALERQRVLTSDVEVAVLAPGRKRRDGHRFDQRERIALHQDAILEGAGLRLVGVADQIVRTRRLRAHGLPLPAGRKRGAAAAHQFRRRDLGDHCLSAHVERARERVVSAGRPVLVQALGSIGRSVAADAARPAAGRTPAALAQASGSAPATRSRQSGPHVDLSEQPLARLLARIGDQRRRRLIAHAQARRPHPDRAVADRDVRSVRRVMQGRPGDGFERGDRLASAPAHLQAMSSQTWTTRRGRGEVASSA